MQIKIHLAVYNKGSIQQFCTKKYLKQIKQIQRTNRQWKGVTCGDCLRVGNKVDRIDEW